MTGEDMHAASALHVAPLIGLYTITEQDGPEIQIEKRERN